MSARPGMILPPVGRDGVDRDCADYGDTRVPAPFGRYDDERWPRPVGYYYGRLPAGTGMRNEPGPCNPDGTWGRNRHLFDALLAEAPEVYVGDDVAPRDFRLGLTCVRCGLVVELAGKLAPEEAGHRDRGFVDPVPLQSGELLAQQVRHSESWGHEDAEWTIYREGQRVGWMATERGQRGGRYVVGALGRRYDNSNGTIEKGASATAVLRKLAKQTVLAPAGAAAAE